MKYILVVTLIFFSYLLFSSQELVQFIQSSGDYYFGEASDSDQKVARDRALEWLVQSIYSVVNSDLYMSDTATNTTYDSIIQREVKVSSFSALKDVEEIHFQTDNGEHRYFLYVRKAIIREQLNKRKQLIFSMYNAAPKMLESGDISSALKCNYHALILLKSLPERGIEYNGKILDIEIPQRISSILQNIDIRLIESQKEEQSLCLIFETLFNDKPVNLLEMEFMDNQRIDCTARDGFCVVKLFSSSMNYKTLQFYIEYMYEEQRHETQAVSEVWDFVEPICFNNKKSIDLSSKNDSSTLSIPSIPSNNVSATMRDMIISKTKMLLEYMEHSEEERSITWFSENTDILFRIKFEKMDNYNHIDFLDNNNNVLVLSTNTGYEIRGIPVHITYPNLEKTETDFLTFDFTPDGKVVDVNFALPKSLCEKFIDQSNYANDWQERHTILKFLEKYRTAYLTRDLDTIDAIFAETATIIVGHVLRKTDINPEIQYNKIGDQPSIEYLRFTKEQYLARLSKSFDVKKEINLRFSTIKISRKNNIKGTYGISMRQSYNSSNYSDEGYLFLLIDFNDVNPQIYVRSWQPQEWSDENMIDLSNFIIRK